MSAAALGIIIVAYLCGSISSAILFCKITMLPDPRKFGSGNPGATNVLRIGNSLAAASVLVFDVLKGALPVWLAYKLEIPTLYLWITAIFTCIGHTYPVLFHFRGGKGMATALGAIAPIDLDIAGFMAGTWLLTVLLSGYSSLGSIVSVLIAPLYVLWFKSHLTLPVVMISLLILLRHHVNVKKLYRGQEDKIFGKTRKKNSDIASIEKIIDKQ